MKYYRIKTADGYYVYNLTPPLVVYVTENEKAYALTFSEGSVSTAIAYIDTITEKGLREEEIT